jgi:hypothetical protein
MMGIKSQPFIDTMLNVSDVSEDIAIFSENYIIKLENRHEPPKNICIVPKKIKTKPRQ